MTKLLLSSLCASELTTHPSCPPPPAPLLPAPPRCLCLLLLLFLPPPASTVLLLLRPDFRSLVRVVFTPITLPDAPDRTGPSQRHEGPGRRRRGPTSVRGGSERLQSRTERNSNGGLLLLLLPVRQLVLLCSPEPESVHFSTYFCSSLPSLPAVPLFSLPPLPLPLTVTAPAQGKALLPSSPPRASPCHACSALLHSSGPRPPPPPSSSSSPSSPSRSSCRPVAAAKKICCCCCFVSLSLVSSSSSSSSARA